MNNQNNINNDPNSIIQAYRLYQKLQQKTQASNKKKGSTKNKSIADLYLKQKKNGELSFVGKKSLKGRLTSRSQLNYTQNLQAIVNLFEQINKQDDSSVKQALKELQQAGETTLTEKELQKAVETLRKKLIAQKQHIETSYTKKPHKLSGLRAVNIKPLMQTTAIIKKSGAAAAKLFETERELRASIETHLCKTFPTITFTPAEIQTIASVLSTYPEKDEVIKALDQGNSEPFKLAVLTSLSSAVGIDIDHLIAINRKIITNLAASSTQNQDVTLQQFGHVFGDSFIQDSGLEGEPRRDIYAALIADYLKTTGQEIPNSAAIAATLENRVSLDSIQTPVELRDEIKKKLNASKETPQRCILMGGWLQHGLVYEVERQKNGKLAFRVYNEGEGIQYHDRRQEGYKTKYAGCIGIKDIPEKLFFRRSFLACLQQLAAMPNKGVADQKPIELLIGHIMPMLRGTKENSEDRVQRFLSPQRSGTCTYRSVLAFLAHVMPPEEYKKFKFGFKMHMLSVDPRIVVSYQWHA